MASSTDDSEPYFSVSTIKIKPGTEREVAACLAEVSEATMKNEPGAKIYRSYKVEGKDEFVCIEKFTSREAYRIHVTSDHVKAWADKYLYSGLFEGVFEFHPLAKDGPPPGGFDRP